MLFSELYVDASDEVVVSQSMLLNLVSGHMLMKPNKLLGPMNGNPAIHKILMIHLGTPPTSFDWQYTTANKEYHVMQGLTPQSFYTDVVRSHTVTRYLKSFLLPCLS